MQQGIRWQTVSLRAGMEIQKDKYFSRHRCQCNLQEYSSSKDLDNQCREPIKNGNETAETKLTTTVCSDRGECLCGECVCNIKYEGKYCECDLCPR